MKKLIALVLTLICVLSLVGCGRSMNDVIGNEPEFVGIVQEVTDEYITVNVNEDDVVSENCPVVQVSLDVEIKDSYLDYSVGDEVVVYYDGNITDGNPAEVNTVYALTLRTPANRESENESNPDKVTFEGEILEVCDGYFLVEPVEGSWELNSADQIEMPMESMDPALEPEVGDIIEVSYSGEILETYPARLSEVYSIKVVEEN